MVAFMERQWMPPSSGNNALAWGGPDHVVSFDVSKAFDSAPHSAIEVVLTHLGVPSGLRFLLLFAHCAAQVRIVTAYGLTRTITLYRGVTQGAVENPILFNLVLEPLLRALPGCLALDPEGILLGYCDDLLLIVHNWNDLHLAIKYLSEYLGALGMKFNPAKCKFVTTEQKRYTRVCLSGVWLDVPAVLAATY